MREVRLRGRTSLIFNKGSEGMWPPGPWLQRPHPLTTHYLSEPLTANFYYVAEAIAAAGCNSLSNIILRTAAGSENLVKHAYSVRYYFTSEVEGSLAGTLGVGSRIIFMPYFGRKVTLGWSTTGKPGTRRGV